MPDSNDLERFLRAQDAVYPQVLAELRNGEKRSHWMWYIFPQLAGLGRSTTAREFAISGKSEATAYLAHAVLGARLLECAETVLVVPEKSAADIFGAPDAMKLRSSATLFAEVSPSGSVFHRILDRFFGGFADPRTLDLLAGRPT